jgi:hypothetical protein
VHAFINTSAAQAAFVLEVITPPYSPHRTCTYYRRDEGGRVEALSGHPIHLQFVDLTAAVPR